MRGALSVACLFVGGTALALPQADIVIEAAGATVTAPMTLVDGMLHQSANTKLAESGTAVFTVNVPTTGDYILQALIDAPAADADSFFLNFDEPPTDPVAIWDIMPLTSGFEERIVTWRGNGSTDVAEFEPKVFTLTAGEHRLFIAGRERARLRSLRLRPYFHPAEDSVAFFQQAYTRIERQASRDFDEVPKADRTPARMMALSERRMAAFAELFERALRQAEANIGTPEGLALLDWLVHAHVSHLQEAGPQGLELLRQHYAADPGVGPGTAYLAHYAQWAEAPMAMTSARFFETVARDNPDRTVRGQALLGLGLLAKRDFQIAEDTRPGAEEGEIARLRAIELLETVRRDYGDCAYLKNGHIGETLAERTGRQLTELRALRLGLPAPEIDGQDLDGVPFRLSDYRGKVVMLVFWASWCGPCIAQVPHEKKIVERFKGRPFVLVGVNGDAKLRDANKAVAQHGIPWRSFWDREDRHITQAWNVLGWPTIYVIDHEGVIRQRLYLDESELEPLVAAAEKKP